MIQVPPTSWKPHAFPYGRRLDGRFAPGVRGEGNFLVPSLRVDEEPHGYRVTAEIPGAERDELQVSLCGPLLRLRGRRAPRDGDAAAPGAASYLSSFQREVRLAQEVDASRIEARFENGVLTVTLPTRRDGRPQEIASRVIQVQ